jgi:ribosomal protein S27E
VSGSPEPRSPSNDDALDLLAAPRSLRRAPSEDDVGFLPIASTLDFWVQDLRDHRARGEGLPEPSITVLAGWLAERIGEAADDWYPIDEFFDQIRGGHGVLWAMCGYAKPQKEEMLGVPCSACDVRLLVRMPGSSYVECEACGHLLTEEEYAAWCKALVVRPRKSVTPRT